MAQVPICLKSGYFLFGQKKAQKIYIFAHNRARLLTALVYKPRDLLHKIHFLTALKTLDATYKQRLVGEQIR